MSNRPGAWQRRRPLWHPKDHHQACPGMRQGFYTHNRIREKLVEEPGEEEVSPHLVVGNPIIQWLRRASQTTPWEPRGRVGHHQHLEQEVLVC